MTSLMTISGGGEQILPENLNGKERMVVVKLKVHLRLIGDGGKEMYLVVLMDLLSSNVFLMVDSTVVKEVCD